MNITDLPEEILLLFLTNIYQNSNATISTSSIYLLIYVSKSFAKIAIIWFERQDLNPILNGKQTILAWAFSSWLERKTKENKSKTNIIRKYKSNIIRKYKSKPENVFNNELVIWATTISPYYTIDCMYYAIKYANIPLIDKCVKMGITNEYCLSVAISYGHLSTYKYLLEFGEIDSNLMVNGVNEYLIIEEMAKRGCINMLKKLLHRGHQFNGDIYKKTIESKMISSNQKSKIIKLLFEFDILLCGVKRDEILENII